MRGLFARARSWWRGLRRPGQLEREMEEEMRFHIDMEAERLVRERGLGWEEARRQAAVGFGGKEKYKEEGRDVRGLTWLTGVSLDLRLALRLLYKHPALTLVSALAMAFAISVGALGLRALLLYTNPTLPLDEGDRVVGIQLWNTETARLEGRSAFAYARWRQELRLVEQVGAFRNVQRNLEVGNRPLAPVRAAEITASAFSLARVPPLLGRPLLEADEQPGRPAVAVIGHGAWRAHFGGDPKAVGREMRIGGVVHTVVGVMPEDFAFPVSHGLWVPLRLGPRAYAPGEGPEIRVFGRLAPGASMRSARAELAALDRRLAAEHSELRPRSDVLPYPESIIRLEPGSETRVFVVLGSVLVVALFALICGNIALLLFARAATRQDELAMRSALGASRVRIVTQLVAEALVLAGVAAVLGTGALRAGAWFWSRRFRSEAAGLGDGVPFWFDGFLGTRYLLCVAGLTLLAAAAIGVIPALRVTGRRLEPTLREGTSGAGAYRFGGVWTVLITAQVAVTVLVPALAMKLRQEVTLNRSLELPFASAEFLAARLEMDDSPSSAEGAPRAARFHDRYVELERRLLADPAVVAVTYTNAPPRSYHPLVRAQLDASAQLGSAAGPDHRTSSGMVDVRYFNTLGVPVVAGRGFLPADLAPTSRVVVVNRSFVKRFMEGRNPVGHRLRYAAANPPDGAPGEWHEIVGVVEDLAMGSATNPLSTAGFYLPFAPGTAEPLYLMLHLRGDPAAFAPRLRALAGAVDPALRVHRIIPVDDPPDAGIGLWIWILGLVGSIALLLSLSAIYAVMSHAVSRRTREIGIRVALGADRGRIVAVVFRRPLIQVAAGILLGALAVALLVYGAAGGALDLSQVGTLLAYAAFMTAVCLLACVVPVRRALGVEPTEAMRTE